MESVFLGLGAAVAERGYLGTTAIDGLVEALRGYAETARQLGATRVVFLGTEPIRRAADAARVCIAVEQGTGVPLHVLTHEEEAYLTLIGVTTGAPVRHETLVVDIGGGSSEFCAVGPGTTARAAGLRLGSNQLASLAVAADPPTPDDLSAMRALAVAAMRGAFVDRPREVLAVGGTATNLLKVTAEGVGDRRLTRPRLAAAMAVLGSTPAAELTERYAVNPARGRLLAAGAAIVEAVLDHYGVDELTVSDAGLREGAILVVDHVGAGWRDRLAELAHGWRT